MRNNKRRSTSRQVGPTAKTKRNNSHGDAKRNSLGNAAAQPLQTNVFVYVEESSVSSPQGAQVRSLVNSEQASEEYRKRLEELTKQYEQCAEVLKSYEKRLRSKAWRKKYGPIVTFNVELLTKFGRRISPLEYVIRIGFDFKLNEDELKAAGYELFPRFLKHKRLGSVRVKVGESRPAFAATLPNGPPTLAGGAVGGIPCAPTATPTAWGTMGVCVRGTTIGITNRHVLPTAGSGVVQLGPAVAGVSTTAALGNTTSRAFLGNLGLSYGLFGVDCASFDMSGFGRPIDARIRGWNPAWGTKIFYPAAGKTATAADVLGRVYLFGARTGVLLAGRLDSANAPFVPVGGPLGTTAFVNVLRMSRQSTTFVEAGNSGSLVMLEIQRGAGSGVLAIGLAFARDRANPAIGFACHLRPVLDQLQIVPPAADVLTSWIRR